MRISAALSFNLIDYPGKIAAVAFTPGCNYRCPHCHAKQLLNGMPSVDDGEFFKYLETVKDWVNGITVCGGEPTLQPDLEPFIREAHCRGLAVKLDTNGSDPELLAGLLADKLVNYVAMDVKGPAELWPATTGKTGHEEAMLESMRLVQRFPDHEFRTTIAPVIRAGGEISFFTLPEMAAAARLITGTTGTYGHKYFVQKFVPRKDGLLDARLEAFPETPPQLLQDIRTEALKFLPNTQIRG